MKKIVDNSSLQEILVENNLDIIWNTIHGSVIVFYKSSLQKIYLIDHSFDDFLECNDNI